MKNIKFSSEDFAEVEIMAQLLMRMNARNSGYTYEGIRSAIISFTKSCVGVDISDVDWNMGGNATFGADIQAAVYAATEIEMGRMADWELERGNITLERLEDIKEVARLWSRCAASIRSIELMNLCRLALHEGRMSAVARQIAEMKNLSHY